MKVVVALLVAAIVVAFAPRSHADTSLESQSLGFVNSTRTSNGMSALNTQAALNGIAKQHANEMASRNAIFHYTDIGARADAAGVNWTQIGENVGVGPTVKDVHDAFMQSPGHRDNILHAAYNVVGVGVAVGKDGSVFVAHEFATVSASAPAPAPAAHTVSPASQVKPANVPSVAPSSAVKVAPKVISKPAPAPANHTTSSDPNALLGGVVR